MGHLRGGLSTKIQDPRSKLQAPGDAAGCPIRLILTPGEACDAPVAADLLTSLAPGATRVVDRACDTRVIRDLAAERGAWANTLPRFIGKVASSSSPWFCRRRTLVERFFNRSKPFRGLGTRYDRGPDTYLAALKLAAIRIRIASI